MQNDGPGSRVGTIPVSPACYRAQHFQQNSAFLLAESCSTVGP
jgi:hypothetical protein